MGLVQKGSTDDEDFDNPHIEEDYYIGKLAQYKTYDRDDEALGLISFFKITQDERHDQTGVELPFFAPANLSWPREGSDGQASRLATNLDNLGREVLEAVLDSLGCKEAVMSGDEKWIATDEQEAAVLQSALTEVLGEQQIRFQVEDNREGDASQVAKLSKLFDGDPAAIADTDSAVDANNSADAEDMSE